MTLPKEISDNINKAAKAAYPINSETSTEGVIKQNLRQIGYCAGATEWAGKAQSIVNMLESTISILSAFIEPALFNQQISNEQRILINTRNEIERALAKYKEVGNEG